MDVLSVGIVDFHEFSHMGFLLGEGEVENAKVVLVCLPKSKITSRERTSLLYSIRASWVLHRVELTTVAE